jgi:hypothetical protein
MHVISVFYPTLERLIARYFLRQLSLSVSSRNGGSGVLAQGADGGVVWIANGWLHGAG